MNRHLNDEGQECKTGEGTSGMGRINEEGKGG
jgi:hypothetical protein